MMHGQRRHETEDRDHGWSRERQGEWEGGRTYLSRGGRQPREELCSDGGWAHLVKGHCRG